MIRLVRKWKGLGLAGVVLSAASIALAAPVESPFSIETPLPGPESRYTALLLKILKNWPPKFLPAAGADPNPVRLRALETPGEKYYIGLEQVMWVDAPIGRIAGVLDDFEHYEDLFEGFDDIHAVSHDRNRWVIFWEQHIPLFFIPNVKYETWYLIDHSNPDRRIYRYQLKDGRGHIKNNDGFIVLEREGPSRTRYVEIDFFDADWGPLKTFAPGRIWKDSVEGLYLSDVAIKLKSENPAWTYEKVKEESHKWLERFPVDPVLARRARLEP